MSAGLGSIRPASMKFTLMLVPISKMSGPVPVGTAAESFCSHSRRLVAKMVTFVPGFFWEYASTTA